MGSTVGVGVGVGTGVGVGASVTTGVGSCVGATSCASSVCCGAGAATTGVGAGAALCPCFAGNSMRALRKPSTKPMMSAMRKHQPHILRYFALILRSTLRIIAARALLSNKTAP